MSHKELTDRELEILSVLAQGATQRETAEELGIAFATVKTHMSKIHAKLNTHSAAQAVAVAFKEDLLS